MKVTGDPTVCFYSGSAYFENVKNMWSFIFIQKRRIAALCFLTQILTTIRLLRFGFRRKPCTASFY